MKKFWYGIGAAVTASYIYNNLDNIKAALGLAEDEAEEDAGEAFASTDKCGAPKMQKTFKLKKKKHKKKHVS